jgi:hypothetical protein
MKTNKYIKKEENERIKISTDKISKHQNEKFFKNDENERIQKMLTKEASVKMKNPLKTEQTTKPKTVDKRNMYRNKKYIKKGEMDESKKQFTKKQTSKRKCIKKEKNE